MIILWFSSENPLFDAQWHHTCAQWRHTCAQWRYTSGPSSSRSLHIRARDAAEQNQQQTVKNSPPPPARRQHSDATPSTIDGAPGETGLERIGTYDREPDRKGSPARTRPVSNTGPGKVVSLRLS
jgi:hypothetical protein